MVRKFIYDGKELGDPDPAMSIEEVRQAHAEFFPELYNAESALMKNKLRGGGSIEGRALPGLQPPAEAAQKPQGQNGPGLREEAGGRLCRHPAESI